MTDPPAREKEKDRNFLQKKQKLDSGMPAYQIKSSDTPSGNKDVASMTEKL